MTVTKLEKYNAQINRNRLIGAAANHGWSLWDIRDFAWSDGEQHALGYLFRYQQAELADTVIDHVFGSGSRRGDHHERVETFMVDDHPFTGCGCGWRHRLFIGSGVKDLEALAVDCFEGDHQRRMAWEAPTPSEFRSSMVRS